MRETDSSFLVRVWRDGKGDAAWRASARDLRTRRLEHFQSLDELLRFLTDPPALPPVEGADPEG